MRVIGTAGHVDHGKSTLIAALTGVHPDRLKEEQEREMTIDLGFGWLTLPDGEEIGIVDVPGHRDFIENMLAGIGGIDAALLVIAADEGVMPQTREHLAILDLLQIPAGVVALTKIDLIQDSAWLDLVESEVRAVLRDTTLQGAPILRVSARTRAGLDKLTEALAHSLRQGPARLDSGRPRLPIDRVFTMSGFGTVVTGTLSDGRLVVGEDIQVLPSGLTGRIRGLQTHKKKEDGAVPGSRTAVNISGIPSEQIQRGQVLTRPGQYQPTRRVDARFRLLKGAASPLRHASEVKVFVGTSETVAMLRLLGTEELQPGQEGWIQLELREPIVTVPGDKYVLRRPSPGETIGGGVVIDAQPKGRHRRFDEQILKSLASLEHGSPADVLFEAALALGPAEAAQAVARSHLEAGPGTQALAELAETGRLVKLEEGELTSSASILVVAGPQWIDLRDRAVRIVESVHREFPLRRGIVREELKSRLKQTTRVFNALMEKLVADGLLVASGGWVAKSGHEIKFNREEQAKVGSLLRKFAQSPYSPPGLRECQDEAGEQIVAALLDSGELVGVSPEVVFRKTDYDEMAAKVRAALGQKGQITLAEVRDLFGTSRKYAQALLEYLDATGVTARDGDYRKLRK
jgi:selenocysteine-specific elongation factor